MTKGGEGLREVEELKKKKNKSKALSVDSSRILLNAQLPALKAAAQAPHSSMQLYKKITQEGKDYQSLSVFKFLKSTRCHLQVWSRYTLTDGQAALR